MKTRFDFPVVRRGEHLRRIHWNRLDESSAKPPGNLSREVNGRLRLVRGSRDIPGSDRRRAEALWAAWSRLGAKPISTHQWLRDSLLVSGWTAVANLRLCPEADSSARDHLADPDRFRDGLIAARGSWKKAVADLVGSGFAEFAVLRDRVPERDGTVDDPFLLVRFGIEEPLRNPTRWGQQFVEWILPGLNQAEGEDLQSLKAAWEALEGERQPGMVSEILPLVHLAGSAGAAARWLEAIRREPRDQRDRLLRQIVRTGAAGEDWKDDALGLLEDRRWLFRERSVDSFDYLLGALRRGFPVEVVREALEIWRRRGRAPRLREMRPFVVRPSERMRLVRARLPQLGGYRWVEFWKACDHRPEFVGAIEALPVSRLTNRELRLAVVVLLGIAKASPADWEVKLSALFRFLAETTGEGRPLDEESISWIEWLFEDCPGPGESWSIRFEAGIRLRHRHRELGIPMHDEIRDFWERWWDHGEVSDLVRLPAIPDSAYRQLRKAMRNYQRADLIVDGTEAFLRAGGREAATMFEAAPGAFLEALRRLGLLRQAGRERAVERFRYHPACEMEPGEKTLAELVVLVEALAGDESTALVPGRLREHLEGTRRLDSRIRERDRERLRLAISLLRVRALGREADRELASLDPEGRLSWHTLAMGSQIDGNRRAMRRFLAAIRSGRSPEGYIRDHPANRAWRARMSGSRFPVEEWKAGIRRTVTTETGVRLEVGVEGRAEEVLRMGTYVGSCLSLGGCYSESAVAVMLDDNKQVVFARRSEDGKVVGRQLLAVSCQGELLAFPVYPLGCGAEISAALVDYARDFSQSLGIPLHRPGDSKAAYEVEPLLCKDWYDDGAIAIPDACPGR